jgi:hypothetical protein
MARFFNTFLIVSICVAFTITGCKYTEGEKMAEESPMPEISRFEEAIKELNEKPEQGSHQGIIECKLAVRKIDGSPIADVTFTNRGNLKVREVKWRLLMGGDLSWSAFAIIRDGRAVYYEGPLVCHVYPWKPENCYTILPGASVTSSVKIGDYYNLSEHGKYSILYDSAFYLEDFHEWINVISPPVTFDIP